MTKEDRQLVVEYIASNKIILASYVTHPKNERVKLIKWHYNTTAFKFYAINHAWKELISYIKKEVYRRWINLIVKYK